MRDAAGLESIADGEFRRPNFSATKDGSREDGDVIEARTRGAAEHVPLERLALSPRCDFASGDYATTMTPAEQEAKLRLVGDIPRRVWPNG